jgi:hypothetical protein
VITTTADVPSRSLRRRIAEALVLAAVERGGSVLAQLAAQRLPMTSEPPELVVPGRGEGI